jgi:2-oxoglutarate ferredoxin oxidoreductase subunit alpha
MRMCEPPAEGIIRPITAISGAALAAKHARVSFVADSAGRYSRQLFDEISSTDAEGPIRGVHAASAPDAVQACLEAVRAGGRAMAVTEGLGLRAAAEQLARAQLAETPLVLLHGQYLPGDGGRKNLHGDMDVALAGRLGVAGIPLPVLAVTDAATTYRLTCVAFGLAEKLRTPIIVLTSKHIAEMSSSAESADVGRSPPAGGREQVSKTARPEGRSSGSRVGCDPGRRDVGGTPGTFADLIDGLRRRFAQHADALECVAADADPDAQTLLISYGSADRAAHEAVARVRSAGARVSHLTIYSLWPVPQSALRRAVTPFVSRILLPECNPGLYAAELAKCVKAVKLESLPRCDGRPIEPEQIVRRITDWPCG